MKLRHLVILLFALCSFGRAQGQATPTNLTLVIAPCNSSFVCTPGTVAANGQVVKLTAHVSFTGTVNPTGQLCIIINGNTGISNCGLTPVSDESWFTPNLPNNFQNVITATYAGNASYQPSSAGPQTITVGTPRNPPTITTQPASSLVNAGQVAVFSVVAAGTAPLTYQWQKNGASISGATGISYTTPPTTPADNNSVFDVIVSNAVGTIQSSNATLTVRTTPPTTGQLTISGLAPNNTGQTVSIVVDPAQPIHASGVLLNGISLTGTITPPLAITTVAPTTGSNGTPTSVTITGTGFVTGATANLICPSGSNQKFPMTSVTLVSSTQLNAVTPVLPNTITLPVSCDVQVNTP